ncbi:unnamed protein product [Heligmosomoides polygyrus]|uniref:HTH_7 domain-containing protein n=1 Tax=Heligmosomoides polygyrus TaxID=6339 RepID=A0A183GE74_HELPZ|nr:unnamed protein product [Heligmosomoides polygyrus]
MCAQIRYNELGHEGDRPGRGRKRTVNTSRIRKIIKKRVDRAWSGRESDVDNNRLRQLVESGPRRTTRELAQDLGVHYATIASYLLNSRLKSIVTGDEKLCLNVNIKRSRRWVDKGEQPEPEPQSKEGPHPSKIMLSVWCWPVTKL